MIWDLGRLCENPLHYFKRHMVFKLIVAISETLTYNILFDSALFFLCVSVLANYTKPEVTMSCSDGFRCLVTCVSHGGYPGTSMMWNVPGSELWKVVNSSEAHDPDTKMVNSSSTAYFNCSSGELRFLSCCVGDVTSDMFSVCEY